MNFLQSYGEKEIRFEWTSYDRGIDYVEWEYGWNDLGVKKIPTTIMNLIVTIVEETGEDMFDGVYSETDGYRLVARFFPKEKTLQLRMMVEEYVSDEIYNERKFPIETSNAIKYMNEKNISNIIFSYDGGGDSGEINSLLVDGKEVSIYTWERNEETMPIINMAYEYLENTYGGWEIDDGSSGTLEIRDNGLISSSHIWSSREWYDSGKEKIITTDNFK